MPSITIVKSAVAGAEKEALTSKKWIQLTVHLESSAGGTNKMGYGGTRTEFMPAETRTFIVAPETRVTFETSSTDPVEWGIHMTELDFIDDFLSVFCQLGAGGIQE